MGDTIINDEGLQPGTIVELFSIDLNPIGYNVKLNFQQADAQGGSVWFGGEEYLPRPIRATGFKTSSEEGPPEPTLSIGNLDKGGYALLNDYSELLGAKFTRISTLAEFLDKLPDGSPNPMADSNATHLPEIWYIEQKAPSNRAQIVFRMKSILDLRGKKFPKRLVLKNVCQRQYRWWNPVSGAFTYSAINACPYAGTNYFTRDGTPTTAENDDCGKDLGGCALRFGAEALPGWFFPGVQRIPRR